ncbi:MAG: hypothetical protein HYS27_13740 [Deltaproteobacteria bacterium]|nr:hypothetical protein [Deltaproteobacteria bacterium]
MQHPSDQPNQAASRRRVRTDGSQSLTDVARLACGDVRLAALLGDLNPGLPKSGQLPSGTNVVCPLKSEVQAFAKKMDFVVGLSPDGSNGTAARRRWAQHVGAARATAPLGAEALARSLLSRGLAVGEAGRRLARQATTAGLQALAHHADPKVRAVGEAALLNALYPKAKSRLHAVRSLLEATGRPGGFRAVLEACERSPAEADAVLTAVAVAAPLRAALIEEAPRIAKVLGQARQIKELERGARDVAVRGQPELAALVAALSDGVEPLTTERADALGLGAEAAALSAHCAQLQLAMAGAEGSLARSPDAIRALALGNDGPNLSRPWPLLATVCRQLGRLLDAARATALDEGLGGLVPRQGGRVSVEGAPACLSVAELRARAAVCARTDDEGDALAARLAPSVVELFGFVRPPPTIDGGPMHARRARRRAAFDHAVAARGEVTGEGAATLVAEALERARDLGMGSAAQLNRRQIDAAIEVARGLPGSLSVHRRPMSELGRALVVAAMALDREAGSVLLRPTGREAVARHVERHAGRVLSAAACRIAAGA